GLRQSLEVIRGNKIRSFLTMLGINFGVGCLIAISIIGLAFRDSVNSEMGRYGSTLLWIQSNWSAYASYEKRTFLTERDRSYFETALPGLISSESIFDASYTVSHKGNAARTTVMGVEKPHFDMFSIALDKGRFFMDDDIQFKSSVCVLRPDIAGTLFQGEDPLGQMITIDEKNFTVIGITERMGQGFISDGSDNNTVFVSQDYISSRIWGGRDIKYWILIMKFDTQESVDIAQERMIHYLNNKYGKIRGEERFRIERLDTYIGMVDKILNIITVLVLVIAIISIVVGGLGIMNIMLVAVTERTREIGIRMAIGATPKDILVQFVIEAVSLCLIGGGTGIIFGASLAALACSILQWEFMISLSIVLGALFISTSIGLIFGIYPSYKASQLMPIEALRSEV
ncbi:MAG: ABC transporter permease, partial [Spirochaetaceae bacterium]|nr:ABC transporter permease [Spirochaetaceae bacterium]